MTYLLLGISIAFMFSVAVLNQQRGTVHGRRALLAAIGSFVVTMALEHYCHRFVNRGFGSWTVLSLPVILAGMSYSIVTCLSLFVLPRPRFSSKGTATYPTKSPSAHAEEPGRQGTAIPGWRTLVTAIPVFGVLLAVALTALLPRSESDEPIAASGSAEVLFSPNGGGRDRLIRSMNLCKSEYLLAVFDITEGHLTQSLIDLTKRGKSVRVVSDMGRAKKNRNSTVRTLRDAGVAVRVAKGGRGGYMHHKFAVVDNRQVITGSYNWSNNAEEHNSENMAVLEGEEWARAYRGEFEKLWARGKPVPDPEPKGAAAVVDAAEGEVADD